MSGRRYFLDTNAIVQLLSGNQSLLTTLAGAAYVATSVICELEFLSFPGLSAEDRALFGQFIASVEVVDLCSADLALREQVLAFRSDRKLRLPDAVIAASSTVHECTLLTADTQVLKTPGLAAEAYPVM